MSAFSSRASILSADDVVDLPEQIVDVVQDLQTVGDYGFMKQHMNHVADALLHFRDTFKSDLKSLGDVTNVMGSLLHEMQGQLWLYMENLERYEEELNEEKRKTQSQGGIAVRLQEDDDDDDDTDDDFDDPFEEDRLDSLFFWVNAPQTMRDFRALLKRFQSAGSLILQVVSNKRPQVEKFQRMTNVNLAKAGMVDCADIITNLETMLRLAKKNLKKTPEYQGLRDALISAKLEHNLSKEAHNALQKILKPSQTFADKVMLRLEEKYSNIPANQIQMSDFIGEGSFGRVYGGSYINLPVALKTLTGAMQSNLAKRRELLQEALAYVNFRHPNIVRFFGSAVIYKSGELDDRGSRDGRLYMVMERCDGALEAEIGHDLDANVLEPEKVLDYSTQIFRGLAFLHRMGIIHRDIKPGNVLMKDGVLKLADFGLAVEGSDTATYTPRGTIRYLAPECLDTPAIWTPLGDVFAMGIVIYEMITNEAPYAGDSELEIINEVKGGSRPSWNLHRRDNLDDPIIQRLKRLAEFCWDQNVRPTSQQGLDLCLARPDDFEELFSDIQNDAELRYLESNGSKGIEAWQIGEDINNDALEKLLNKCMTAKKQKEVEQLSLELMQMKENATSFIMEQTLKVAMLRGNIIAGVVTPWLIKYRTNKTIVLNTLDIFAFAASYDAYAAEKAIDNLVHKQLQHIMTGTHSGVLDVVEMGAKCIVSLTQIRRRAHVLLQDGMVLTCVVSLRKPGISTQTAIELVTALGNMGKDEALAKDVVQHGGIRDILKLSKVHKPRAASAALYALANLSKTDVEVIRGPIKKKRTSAFPGTVKRSALKREEKARKNSSMFETWGQTDNNKDLGEAAAMAGSANENESMSVASSFVKKALFLMEEFPEDDIVQRHGCELIGNFVRRHHSAFGTIWDEHPSIFDIIVSAMREHVKDKRVQTFALSALNEIIRFQSNVDPDTGNRSENKNDLKHKAELAHEQKAEQSVLTAMRNFPKDRYLIGMSCSVLFHMIRAGLPEIENTLRLSGAISTVRAAMKFFYFNASDDEKDEAIHKYSTRILQNVERAPIPSR